ncbi:MAG: ribosome maturation factor RimP [Acidimicrobiia bacterium]|nr:ribosome maturation factor RimP [Acidimicrobiia bacterium]NNF68877.1 ribosome maturation factor RimP [Acidimicrobiia bacterium]
MTVEVGDRLWKLLEGYVSAEGVELDDVVLVGQGKGRVLRVIVDADSGVTLDHIARLSKGLGRVLDEEDAVQGAYTLEVSSPGLERKLRRPAHYRKSVGREVKVKTSVPIDGERAHRGVLEEADDNGFSVQVDGTARRIAYGDVKRAATVFTWEEKAKRKST